MEDLAGKRRRKDGEFFANNLPEAVSRGKEWRGPGGKSTELGHWEADVPRV